MPSRPYIYQVPEESRPLDLSALALEINAGEEKRNHGYDQSRKLQVATVKAKTVFEREASDEELQKTFQELEALVIETVGPTADRNPREANLGYRVEELVRIKGFLHFLTSGSLLSPSDTPYATDEEYLSGACMGLSQDLSRYGMGRATARDVKSVEAAKDLVAEILDYLLQFDFRNGPLRRKYDGVKYQIKTLETLLYELAVTGSPPTDANETRPAKIQKNDNELEKELTALRQRYEHRDTLREDLIKRCRDGQKAAKQSIYALHRGDAEKAKNLLNQCESCIQKDLLPTVQEEPQLRYGSFANLLEEYAEGKLFYAWMFGNTETVPMSPHSGNPAAVLLLPNEFQPIVLEDMEYLGGLCDLTGEVGRFAVQKATARDEHGVKLCLQTNKAILTAIQSMERTPQKLSKKMDQLCKSVEKLERILYELSLSEATGRNVQTNSMNVGEAMDKADD